MNATLTTVYQIACFFVIYAFFGWCLEVVYQAVEHGKFINRGFLNGPYCPIYGFGVIIVCGALEPIKENLIVLYFGAVILTSTLEFITGFLLEKIFRRKWWDYTGERFNLKGYICLKFSLLWGVACLVTVRLIHPLVTAFVEKLPQTLGIMILSVILIGFLSDAVITVCAIIHIRNRLILTERISTEMRKISDATGEKLFSGVEFVMDKKKRVLIIGGSAGAAALVALIVVTIVLANRPSALIVRGLVNTISDAKRIEVFDVADDVANGGSIAVSANLDKFAKDDVTVEAKLYTDLDSLKGGYEMTVAEDDEKVLQARVLYSEDKFAFTCPELVDGAYGINYKNLEKNLPGSIFDPDEETDYSLSEEQFDYFLNLKDTAKNNKNLERDIDNMSAKYRKLIVEKLVKYAEVGRSSKTITVGGEKIPCTVISLSIDQDALALAVTDVVEYALEDKDLEKLVNRVAANGSYNEEPDEIIDEFYDSLDEILDNISELRAKAGDRAVLRAIHFVEETRRASDGASALKEKDFSKFLKVIRASGNSSFKYLQNIYSSSEPKTQNVSIALAVSDSILGEDECSRVHGGGFAGTIQAFVRNENTDRYRETMDKIFGEGSCQILKIRKYGGIKVL